MTIQSVCPDDVRTSTTGGGDGPVRRFLARTRHGAAGTAAIAKAHGVAAVEAARASGTVLEPWPGVLVTAEHADDPLTRAAAALLRAGADAVLSGTTAAALHGCPAAVAADPTGGTISVTIPYDRQQRCLPGLSVHQAWIRESDVVELDGLRVFALDLTLAELLCTGQQRMALACLEQAMSWFDAGSAEHLRGLVEARLSRRRDRRGTRRAAALLAMATRGEAMSCGQVA